MACAFPLLHCLVILTESHCESYCVGCWTLLFAFSCIFLSFVLDAVLRNSLMWVQRTQSRANYSPLLRHSLPMLRESLLCILAHGNCKPGGSVRCRPLSPQGFLPDARSSLTCMHYALSGILFLPEGNSPRFSRSFFLYIVFCIPVFYSTN